MSGSLGLPKQLSRGFLLKGLAVYRAIEQCANFAADYPNFSKDRKAAKPAHCIY
jgi:hypothetical protein